jgi:hypothetical protein
LIEAEAADFLARRVLLERGDELPDDLLRWHEQKGAIDSPFGVADADTVADLEGIRPQVEDLRQTQGTNGSCQTEKPSARCSWKTIFQSS